jgi:hypothetical protein
MQFWDMTFTFANVLAGASATGNRQAVSDAVLRRDRAAPLAGV